MKESFPVALMKKEEIILELKPLPKVVIFWSIHMLWVPILLLFIILFSVLPHFFPSLIAILLSVSLSLILSLIVSVLTSFLRYRWEYYWITNERVVRRKGIIGYTIDIIPLERISDIRISRTFFERLLGFGGLHLQTLAGQYSQARYGAEISIDGISNPESVQDTLLDLIKKKRKREGLMF
jgi:uncharacterized membrane protein YdbT with pleckstrin-like domain